MYKSLQQNKYLMRRSSNFISLLVLYSLILLGANSLFAQGSAVNFDGNNNPSAYNYSVDYISIPSDPALNLNGDFTIEMWFNMETTGGWANPSEQFYQPTWQTLISKGYWVNANEFAVLVSPNLLYVAINGQVYLASANIQTNQWYHMALTRTNGLLQFYVDGNLLTSSGGTQNISSNINNTKELRIGKNYGGSKFTYSDSHAYGFDGSIDEVRIWNVARTQAEIADNMNYNELCSTTGLTAYFPFDENGGTTVSSTVGGFIGNLIDGAGWNNGVSVTPPAACPTLQTLTILGGSGVQGQIDPYTEASRDGGATWQPAYLTGWHPWGFAEGTNSWVNFDPSPFVGLYSTTDYRIRFYVPADFYDPHMTFVIKADNRALLSINGVFVSEFDGQGSGAAGDQVIAQAITPGLNEIQIRLTDWGGWVGLNYRIDLTMFSLEELTLEPSTFSNTDPVAKAGDDQNFDCTPATGAEVTLDGSGSTDDDGDQLTYSWSNGAATAAQTLTLVPGIHTFTLTVNDGNGGTSSDDVTVTINADEEAPVPDLETLADVIGECGAIVTEIPTATDACDGEILATTNDPLEYSNQGEYVITWTYSDANGNSVEQIQNVFVQDATLPTIAASTQQLSLWPPNHKYETVSLSDFGISVSDNCADVSTTSLIITKVTSDEAENAKGKGDGNTEDDIVIANDFQSVDLRKERAGNGNGRVYNIFVALSDGSGNVVESSFQVLVNHSRKKDAIDDGAAYEVEGGSVVLYAENDNGVSDLSLLAKNGATNSNESAVQSIPTEFELSQNYPNPFNPSTTIQVALPDAGSYRLNVYNLLGEHVASLFSGQLGVGIHSFNFDASQLSTGVYIYSLRGEQVNISKKMSLMK